MAEQEIRLQDIFDMDFIQKFQDDFARAVGMTAVTVDLDGTPVTHPTDWTDFCMKYTRGCPKGKARCEKCDADNGAKAAREGRPQVYECHAGLMDFAAPIMLNGKQVGSILGGQVLTQPLDEEKYRRVAQEIGVDPDEFPPGVRLDHLRVVVNLGLVGRELFVAVRGYSGIARNPPLPLPRLGEVRHRFHR